jgi:hypothetical protein
MFRDDANDLGEAEARAGFRGRRKMFPAESLESAAITMCQCESELLRVRPIMR